MGPAAAAVAAAAAGNVLAAGGDLESARLNTSASTRPVAGVGQDAGTDCVWCSAGGHSTATAHRAVAALQVAIAAATAAAAPAAAAAVVACDAVASAAVFAAAALSSAAAGVVPVVAPATTASPPPGVAVAASPASHVGAVAPAPFSSTVLFVGSGPAAAVVDCGAVASNLPAAAAAAAVAAAVVGPPLPSAPPPHHQYRRRPPPHSLLLPLVGVHCCPSLAEQMAITTPTVTAVSGARMALLERCPPQPPHSQPRSPPCHRLDLP